MSGLSESMALQKLKQWEQRYGLNPYHPDSDCQDRAMLWIIEQLTVAAEEFDKLTKKIEVLEKEVERVNNRCSQLEDQVNGYDP